MPPPELGVYDTVRWSPRLPLHTPHLNFSARISSRQRILACLVFLLGALSARVLAIQRVRSLVD